MPFAANWLEELLVEWLKLEGFAVSTSVFVPAPPGGRWAPDVVGAKLATPERLLIRRCEASMGLIQGPEQVKKKFKDKFSDRVQEAVKAHFARIFGEIPVEYEKWVVTGGASNAVQQALSEAVDGLQIHMLKRFVFQHVLRSISKWRSQLKPYSQPPSDKWLLSQIDLFHRWDLLKEPLAGQASPAVN